MIKVLHITAHMGGGVGKFLSEVVSYKDKDIDIIHKIILLEKPEKTQFVEIASSNGVDIMIGINKSEIKKEMLKVDVVILHWWHHPLMAKFLYEFPDVDIRLVVWSHVSGCNYPSIPFDFISLPNKVFFTSPYSYENSRWTEEQCEYVKENTSVVYGLGVDSKKSGQKLKTYSETGFCIGYVGTLSPGKIHPDYVEFCKKTHSRIPETRFVLVGDIDDNGKLREEFEKNGLIDFVEFIGYTNNVDSYLETFDVFGYPLNPFHFGTTENVLIEAMLKELPVVMLNQCTEKHIVENMVDGILVGTSEEYAEKMEYLFNNKDERRRIGKNAKKSVETKFNIESNILKMYSELIEVCESDMRKFEFVDVFGDEPYKWFLACLGEDWEIFQKVICSKKLVLETSTIRKEIESCKPILRGKGKSSINHFADIFPEDKILQKLQKIIKV